MTGEARPNTECCSKATETATTDASLVLACTTQESWTYTAPDTINPAGLCQKMVSTIHSDGVTIISDVITQEANNDPCCTSGIQLNNQSLLTACSSWTRAYSYTSTGCLVTEDVTDPSNGQLTRISTDKSATNDECCIDGLTQSPVNSGLA